MTAVPEGVRFPAPDHPSRPIDTHPVTRLATDALLEGYHDYAEAFRRLTGSAVERFEAAEWDGLGADAEARLLLYPKAVARLVVRLGQLSLWQAIPLPLVRRRFATAVASRPDADIALTFYNSAVRRLQGTVGVDQAIEFLDLEPAPWPGEPELRHRPIEHQGELAPAIGEALDSLGFFRFSDRKREAAKIAARLRRDRPDVEHGGDLAWIPAPFVRNRRAFLIGRLTTTHEAGPVVVALVHGADGLIAEAVVDTADDASIVFGFTRSYFQTEVRNPRATVGFLRSLLPTKRIDELYTVIGYHRHGKREFYQELHRTLADPDIRFEPIEGTPGMVMIAFVLRPMNAVFKVIRDRALPPKLVTRREVMAKYRFVFLKEHGGRLADTQEFEGLALPKRAFSPSVEAELVEQAKETLRDGGDQWILRHLYTERRMTPLDVFLRSAPANLAEAAVVDFGRAIKELAGINVFPGDLLAKNFGVTRHGRVVFYDYDEICSIADCRFRTMPAPRSFDDEIAAEPWFSVRDNDVFPEEFERFIRFPEPLHQRFRSHHRDLFSADFWNGIRHRVLSGETTEPPPYGPEHLLR